MNCKNCNAQLNDGEKICPNCGATVEEIQQPIKALEELETIPENENLSLDGSLPEEETVEIEAEKPAEENVEEEISEAETVVEIVKEEAAEELPLGKMPEKEETEEASADNLAPQTATETASVKPKKKAKGFKTMLVAVAGILGCVVGIALASVLKDEKAVVKAYKNTVTQLETEWKQISAYFPEGINQELITALQAGPNHVAYNMQLDKVEGKNEAAQAFNLFKGLRLDMEVITDAKNQKANGDISVSLRDLNLLDMNGKLEGDKFVFDSPTLFGDESYYFTPSTYYEDYGKSVFYKKGDELDIPPTGGLNVWAQQAATGVEVLKNNKKLSSAIVSMLKSVYIFKDEDTTMEWKDKGAVTYSNYKLTLTKVELMTYFNECLEIIKADPELEKYFEEQDLKLADLQQVVNELEQELGEDISGYLLIDSNNIIVSSELVFFYNDIQQNIRLLLTKGEDKVLDRVLLNHVENYGQSNEKMKFEILLYIKELKDENVNAYCEIYTPYIPDQKYYNIVYIDCTADKEKVQFNYKKESDITTQAQATIVPKADPEAKAFSYEIKDGLYSIQDGQGLTTMYWSGGMSVEAYEGEIDTAAPEAKPLFSMSEEEGAKLSGKITYNLQKVMTQLVLGLI